MKNILIIEDDHNIAQALKSAFEAEGYRVDHARDGEAGLVKLGQSHPDLIILDWMLPGMDGLAVLRNIRAKHNTPVLFLTARDEETDKVVGLELGADDYLTKPFGIRELVARVRSLIRRANPEPQASKRLVFGDIEILCEERRVLVGGQPTEMTRTEFDLLEALARNPGMVLTREILLDRVWGYSFDGYQRTVDTHVRRVRKKIEKDPKNPRHVQTVWGVGYRFERD